MPDREKYNSIKWLLLAITSVSVIWLFFVPHASMALPACQFRQTFSIPCPACGTTTAIKGIIQGHLTMSYNNPLGVLVFGFLILLAALALIDMVTNHRTFEKAIATIDNFLTTTIGKITLAFLILMNWIWVIYQVQA